MASRHDIKAAVAALGGTSVWEVQETSDQREMEATGAKRGLTFVRLSRGDAWTGEFWGGFPSGGRVPTSAEVWAEIRGRSAAAVAS